MEYNTTRNHLIMKEYGRHIQKMIEYLLSLEDREERQRNAYAVIELMGFLNPHLKNVEDFRHKLWDHLFLISDFKLDVESPYPIPTRETLKARPERLRYPKKYPKFNHLGKNIEVVIDKALSEENPEKKQGFANAIAYYMKLTYSNWHKELVHDDAIQSELSSITKGQLEFNNRPFVKHRVDIRDERDDYGSGRGNTNYRKNFGSRDNRGGGGRDNRGNSGGRDNRGGQRDNRGGGGNTDNRTNRNFKKRF
ncbi:MAG: DUF4290 domain-containing protein [Chitinophagaceae bacterium]|nr:DUF4290 domain-containing protein [Chitinophagaceae bacterium]MBL0055731.1 DUF4290 domain-containing protein [Chitinophagaceae bacterium]